MAKIKITEQQARLLGLKPNVKVKITKEQYNRIFASGLINENNIVNGGLNRVDKTFKKEFGGKLKETSTDLTNEVKNLIKYMYRKDENFSPFWVENGLTYEQICDTLLNKNMVVLENGKYTVSKSLGEPLTAIKMIEDTLREMIGGDKLTELDNYPSGSEFDSSAPWNQKDNRVTPKKSGSSDFKVLHMNPEIAILMGNGGLYVFNHYDLGEDILGDYSDREEYLVGKDEDGDPEYGYGEFEKTKDTIENYVNDNIGSLPQGDGVIDFENGVELVKIDDDIKNEILRLYDKDKGLVNALTQVNEIETGGERIERLKAVINAKRAESERLEAERQSRLDKQNAIDSAKAQEKMKLRQQMDSDDLEGSNEPDTFFGSPWNQVEETTTAASSGSFTAPIGTTPIKRENPINDLDVPVVRETTDSSSSGQYTANALPGIDRDGSFKETKKTKAQKKTQYAGGSFVDFNDCTKLNNKSAGVGCSQGAVDNVVKYKKTKDNVNAPSLSENDTK